MNDIVLRGSGLDCIDNLVTDGHVRPIQIDGEIYVSLVDLMAVFGMDNRKQGSRGKPFNARRYWNQNKKSLLGKDDELYDSIVQLKAVASDGKRYSTDFAPLWSAVFIVLLMNTDAATAFKKRIAKFTDAEIKYRMMNVAHGLEWAADTIQAEIQDLEIPSQSTAWEEMGYNGDSEQ